MDSQVVRVLDDTGMLLDAQAERVAQHLLAGWGWTGELQADSNGLQSQNRDGAIGRHVFERESFIWGGCCISAVRSRSPRSSRMRWQGRHGS